MFLTQKERIALICVDADPTLEIGQEEAGGKNVYVRQVGYALAQQGWQVDMFTRRSSAEQAAIVQHSPNCRTIRLKAGPSEFREHDGAGRSAESDCAGRSAKGDRLFEYLPEFIQEFLAFQAREGFQYRLIHTNYWLSAWVGMKLKKHQPLVQVHTYHSLGAVKYNSVRDIPAIAMKQIAVEKICLETVERVVATSPQEQENMRSLVSTQGQIEVIPCGTDSSKFGAVERSSARQILGITPDTKMVLYVGRFDPRKGIETLVKAIAQSSFRQDNLKLVIAGGSLGKSDGIERARIERLVAQLGLTDCTIFPGRLDDTQLSYYYAAADVCVMPSYYEPFGLVAIEAMASRTPVVASNIGGLQFTVIPEVTGLLVPPKDESAFATAIDRILSNPTWRNQLGEAARHRVETIFNWQGVATRLSQLYSHLLLQASLSQAISASLHKSKVAA